jgi:phosphoglycerate dehydrogenase-like enzyme
MGGLERFPIEPGAPSSLRVALADGRLHAVALDCFHEEPPLPNSVLWTLSTVLITPRIGSTGRTSYASSASGSAVARENIALSLDGSPLHFFDAESGRAIAGR